MKLDYAKAASTADSRAVLFSADTNAAGNSESFLGAQQLSSKIRSPDFIRQASNESPSLPRNFADGTALFDDGSLSISAGTADQQVEHVKQKFLDIWSSGRTPICLGGDHLVKHAALRALQEVHPETLVVYVDAHPDIVQSDSVNYATVIHHALARKPELRESLFLVGLRQINEAEARGLREWKPQIIWGQDFFTQPIDEIYERLSQLKGRFASIYFSIDLDGLDPSCAPAVEAPFPGGPHLPHLLELIHRSAQDFKIVGLDISEFIPDLDPTRITALTSATILKEVVSCLK